MSPARALLVDDTRFERHISPPSHPERPERLVAARRGLAAAKVEFTPVAFGSATDEDLARVHDPRFLEALAKLRGRSAYIDPDTFVSPESVEVARLAAGSL